MFHPPKQIRLYPPFLSESDAGVEDTYRHIDYGLELVGDKSQAHMLNLMESHGHTNESCPAETDESDLVLPLNRGVENIAHENRIHDNHTQSNQQKAGHCGTDLV